MYRCCPGCNLSREGCLSLGRGIHCCPLCGALFGECVSLAVSYEYVKPRFASEDVPPQRWRYYDFTCHSGVGTVRRHGWFDRDTGLIVQVG